MQTIWKYELEPMNTESVMMPQGSKILHVDNQDGKVCLWALVDPAAPSKAARIITVVGTGHQLWKAEDGKKNTYIGTVVVNPFVWHVFELN